MPSRCPTSIARALRGIGDAALLDELVEEMVQSWGRGPARLELAVEKEGVARAAAIAHGLRGVAATLGAMRVRDCAIQFERAALADDRRATRDALDALGVALARFVDAVRASKRDD